MPEIAQIISGERLLKYLARDYFQIERRAWRTRLLGFLDRGDAGARYVHIFLFSTVAYANSADNFTIYK